MNLGPEILLIEKYWDYVPHIDNFYRFVVTKESSSNIYYHISRKNEIRLIDDFITRRMEGSLLLSGRRGIGKTSLIHASLINCIGKKTQKNDKILLPVLIDAPSIELPNWDAEPQDYSNESKTKLKKIIVQNLVRGLYWAYEERVLKIKDTDLLRPKRTDQYSDKNLKSLQEKISELFNRSRATKFIEELNIKYSDTQSIETYTSIHVHLTSKSILKKITASSLSGPAYLVGFSFLPLDIGQYLALAIVAAVVTNIIVNFDFLRRTTKKKEAVKEASSNYLHDYALSTLQTEFEQTLRELQVRSFKVIFVIDELDKLPHKLVIKILEGLKTLFNQSQAIFVLITDRILFEILSENELERGVEYTLFSQKLFLQRPQFNEVRKFLDNIVKWDKDQSHVIKLMEWNERNITTNLGSLVSDNLRTELGDLEDTKIIKNKNEISINFESNSNQIVNANVTMKRTDINALDEMLILTNSNNTTFELGISQKESDGENPSLYLRTLRYRNFQDYILYICKSDFFELYSKIRDLTNENTNGFTINTSLDGNQTKLSYLQRIIEYVFLSTEITAPSKWHLNDILLTNLYDLMNMILKYDDGNTLLRINHEPFYIEFVSYDGSTKGTFNLRY